MVADDDWLVVVLVVDLVVKFDVVEVHGFVVDV